MDATIFDVYGALGIEFARPFQYQQIKFGFGLEFRKSIEGNKSDAIVENIDPALESNYLFFRTSINVPITPSNSSSLQYGKSLAGDKPSILAINFNWKLLLEGK